MRWSRASRAVIWSWDATRRRSSKWRVSLLEDCVRISWIMSLVALFASFAAMPASPWVGGGFWSAIGCCGAFWGMLPWPWGTAWPAADSKANLKISKESGFSGVAAEMPNVFPAGRAI